MFQGNLPCSCLCGMGRWRIQSVHESPGGSSDGTEDSKHELETTRPGDMPVDDVSGGTVAGDRTAGGSGYKGRSFLRLSPRSGRAANPSDRRVNPVAPGSVPLGSTKGFAHAIAAEAELSDRGRPLDYKTIRTISTTGQLDAATCHSQDPGCHRSTETMTRSATPAGIEQTLEVLGTTHELSQDRGIGGASSAPLEDGRPAAREHRRGGPDLPPSSQAHEWETGTFSFFSFADALIDTRPFLGTPGPKCMRWSSSARFTSIGSTST